ncbi:hypothetical protein TI39_contig924g00001, partial [Zymoseptoria brevis]
QALRAGTAYSSRSAITVDDADERSALRNSPASSVLQSGDDDGDEEGRSSVKSVGHGLSSVDETQDAPLPRGHRATLVELNE